MTSPALEQLAGRVRSAARVVARAPSSVRDDALRLAADLLEEERPSLVEANRADLERAEAAGMAEAARDRLRLTEDRVGRHGGVACARWRPCPTRSARSPRAGCGPTACGSRGCGSPSAWSA